MTLTNAKYYTFDCVTPDGHAAPEGDVGISAGKERQGVSCEEDAWIRITDHAHAMMRDNPGTIAQIVTISWGDCWIKCPPGKAADELRREAYEGVGLSAREPGSHPGGNNVWFEPDGDVFAVTLYDGRCSGEPCEWDFDNKTGLPRPMTP